MPERARSSWALGDVDQRHVVAGDGRHLGDPGAHLARAHHADPLGHGGEHLEHGRVALGGARADRGDADPAAAAAQLVHERAEQPRARGADGMAERDRAAVHVHPLGVDPEQVDRVQGDRAERLVHLEQVDVRQPRARPSRARPWSRPPACAPGRRSRRRRTRPSGSRPAARRPRSRAQSSDASTSAAAPSFTPGALPAVVAPSFENTGGSAASRSAEVSRRGPSSVSTTVSPRRPGIVTGTISSASRPASMAAIARSWLRSAHASCCSRVMPDLGRHLRVLGGHDQAVERAREPVGGHRVDQRCRRRTCTRTGPSAAGTARSTCSPCRPRRSRRARRRG